MVGPPPPIGFWASHSARKGGGKLIEKGQGKQWGQNTLFISKWQTVQHEVGGAEESETPYPPFCTQHTGIFTGPGLARINRERAPQGANPLRPRLSLGGGKGCQRIAEKSSNCHFDQPAGPNTGKIFRGVLLGEAHPDLPLCCFPTRVSVPAFPHQNNLHSLFCQPSPPHKTETTGNMGNDGHNTEKPHVPQLAKV